MPSLNRMVSVFNRDPVDTSLRITGLPYNAGTPMVQNVRRAALRVSINGSVRGFAWTHTGGRGAAGRTIRVGDTVLYASVIGAFPLPGSTEDTQARYMRGNTLVGIWPTGTVINIRGNEYTTSRQYNWASAIAPGTASQLDVVDWAIAEIPIVPAVDALTIGDTDIPVSQANVEYPPTTEGTTVKVWADLREEDSGRSENEDGSGISVTIATFLIRYSASLYADRNLGTTLTDDDGRRWAVTAFDRIGDKEFLAVRVRREREIS